MREWRSKRGRDYHRVKRAVNGDYEGKREDEDLPSDDSIKGQKFWRRVETGN